MFELKLIEKEFRCANKSHKEPVEMVIWDPQIQQEQRLICKICQQQQSGAKSLMPISQALDRTYEKQKKLMEKISYSIKGNQKYLETLQNEIQNLKAKACSALDGILENTRTWLASLMKIGESNSNYSFLKELDKMITQNDNYASEELVQIMEAINKENNAFFQKIDDKLNNFFLFKEYKDCQQSLINVISVNLSDFTQSEIIVPQEETKAQIKQKALCKIHKKEIVFVNLSENIDKDQRTYCKQCNKRDGEFLEDFIDQWKTYDLVQKNSVQQAQDQLQLIVEEKKQQLDDLRFDFVTKLSKGIRQLWVIRLRGLKYQFEISSQLTTLFNEGQINEMAERFCKKEQLKNYDYKLDIEKCFEELVSELSNCYQQLKPKESKNSKKHQQRLIGMSFNSDGSKFASSSDADLILWSLKNQEITQIAKLQGHNDYINCVLFNSASNGIITGCEDSSIRLWKETSQNEWQSVQAVQKHSDRITCIVLNSKNDLLFSGSSDSNICIWNVDFQNSLINFKQILKHESQDIYSLSLNQSNTFLVSCSFDQKIAIWDMSHDKQWKLKQLVNNEVQDFGYRLSFLNDNVFIWLSANEGLGNISVFELQDQVFVEQKEKKQQLPNSINDIDCMYFPIVYDQKSNAAFVKHKKHLYYFKLGRGFSDWTANSTELGDDNHIFGAVSPNGQKLAIYNMDEKRLQFFTIELD